MDNMIINTVYIDDGPEAALSRYLNTFHKDGYSFFHKDIKFSPEDGYESLLCNPIVRAANIIFIDSKLFENRTAVSSKLSGEEFKMILKKELPFIEVFVITQNEMEEGLEKIAKYNFVKMKDIKPQVYYEQIIPHKIDNALRNIKEYRIIASKLKQNISLESVVVEKVTNSLEGNGIYDELTKADIDQLIGTFREVQAMIDDK